MDRSPRALRPGRAGVRHAAGPALAALLLAAPALAAQQPHGGDGRPGHPPAGHGDGGAPMSGHMRPGAMMAHVPTAILHQRELLGLSEAQVREVRALEERMPRPGEGREELRAAHEQLRAALGAGGIDVEAYESALREMTDRMVRRRVEAARTAREALEALDADQRGRFLHGLLLMRRMHRMHGGGMDGHGGDGPGKGDGSGGHGGHPGRAHGDGAKSLR